MGILKYIEYGLAQLLYNQKGRDSKLFTKGDLFKDIPQNIKVQSPELGPSGSYMKTEHTQFGASKFPQLTWSTTASNVKEYMLICEDPDAPLPFDIEIDGSKPLPDGGKWLSGGFRLGKNLRGTIYSGSRPAAGHGEHRYFYQVVTLKEEVNVDKNEASRHEGRVAGGDERENCRPGGSDWEI
ncbi:uncharacterized protein Z518_04979 [Rhinocladiella mackenziei CBS 650.93]|uniref:Phosphatidylethanolamine-binding protein n=1 Tax=Rhinocladiella mackenziei CBS 650.93 TaxID=1442369 RepID=A0A0D2H971_9EURO|nr:uncharacterized protein Z518_04979 [Rhinocladiella mackenziei CBS 650.93]KIX07003.1 hypothetical protein Z518_04979 [Rhinocladiella mackenziei CBS 650.93]